MSWREELKTPGIQTKVERSDPSSGGGSLWTKCMDCGAILFKLEIERNNYVCLKCNYHFVMPARARIEMLADAETFKEEDADLETIDWLAFQDQKKYTDRVKQAQTSSNEKEGAIWGEIEIEGYPVSICVFVFEFMAGSMGAVVGEKITRCFERAREKKIPAIVISSSGGARMQEGIFSLMQMAKTCAALEKMKEEGLPYISILCHPTTGGVAASFSMLGDIQIAEPGALIGFAGPRVIEQTIRQKLPEGFQRAPFLLENGMIDCILPRKEHKKTIAQIFKLLKHRIQYEQTRAG